MDNEDAKWRLPLDFHTYTLKKALFITFFTCNFPILRISLNWLAPVGVRERTGGNGRCGDIFYAL
ncbi:hypothetical protein ACLFKX_06630 [Enterobacter hormaechei]